MIKRYYEIIKQVFELKATNKKCLFHLLFSAILRSLALLTIPIAASKIVDVATTGNFELTIRYAIIYVICAIIYVILHHYNFEAYAKNSIYTHNKLQELIFDKITSYDENFTKDISVPFIVNTSYNDVGKVMQIADNFFDAIGSIINMLIAIVVLFFVDPIIGGITLVLNLISFTCLSYNMKRRDECLKKQRECQDQVSGIMGQVIDGTKEIKAFNMTDDIEKYLNSYKANWNKSYLKKRKYQDRIDVTIRSILGMGEILAYLIMIILILNNKYEIATLVLVIGYYENIITELDKLFNVLAEISSKAIRVERVSKLLNYKNKNMLEFGNNDNDFIKGKVEFKNVTFNYEKQVSLDNVSFTINPHTLTAIVGKSGHGKSTIFRLLLRLYKLNKGAILLDDVSIYDYSKEVYSSNVSIVTQKPFIFDMSIRENFNLVDSNHEHQVEACKRVGIHDYIMSLKDGYNTKLVRDAENISTGQKQLIALARTLLSKSEVLLFDEVTSSLDVNTSKKIINILKDLKKDHTVIMITHKPDLMKVADEIMVINKGKLVGKGRHEELMKKNKYYQILQK